MSARHPVSGVGQTLAALSRLSRLPRQAAMRQAVSDSVQPLLDAVDSAAPRTANAPAGPSRRRAFKANAGPTVRALAAALGKLIADTARGA